jgi:gamma-glutamyl-gamma-aminobutyraldehyde dehydrogenase
MSLTALASRDFAAWQATARSTRARIETRLFIDGKFVDAVKGGRFGTINPATGETLAQMAAGTAEDIDRAVAAGRRAFREGVWSRMAPRARMEVMYRFAALIEREAESLAVLETLDMGKPVTDMITVDLPGDRHHPFFGRVHRQDRRLVTIMTPASCTQPREPLRGRRHLAVELPVADGGVETAPALVAGNLWCSPAEQAHEPPEVVNWPVSVTPRRVQR